MKRGKRGVDFLILQKKKKNCQDLEDWECPLCLSVLQKQPKKEYFREHFRASEFKHALFSKCSYYHTTTSSIARRA